MQEYFVYFKIFKPISWDERPAERRSRFIQRFPKDFLQEMDPPPNGFSIEDVPSKKPRERNDTGIPTTSRTKKP